MLSIADTGFLVAFAAEAATCTMIGPSRVADEVTEPLLACEAVLAETAFHLSSVEVVLEMIGDELVRSLSIA